MPRVLLRTGQWLVFWIGTAETCEFVFGFTADKDQRAVGQSVMKYLHEYVVSTSGLSRPVCPEHVQRKAPPVLRHRRALHLPAGFGRLCQQPAAGCHRVEEAPRARARCIRQERRFDSSRSERPALAVFAMEQIAGRL